MYEILQLENFKEFSCTGDKCPDNCCHSWTVYINKATYKKYKKNKSIKSDNLVIIDKSNSGIYSEIKLKEDGNCPFLDETGLCDIHKNHGKNLLSDVCKIYPQKLTKFNNRLERSIRLSCPAAVDLLFKSKEPLEFNISIEDKKLSIVTSNEDLGVYENFKNDDFFTFRSLAITILQYREVSLKERLHILGKACDIVGELIKSNEYESSEIRAYVNELESTFKTEEMLKIKEEYIFKGNEKYELLSKIIPLTKDLFNENSNKNKTKNYDIIKKGLLDTNNIKPKDVMDFKTNVMDKFFSENEYLLEHYLVCKVFEDVFPKNSSSIENAFNLMLNKLLMLHLYLIILYKDYEKLRVDDFKDVLYFFERQLSHSDFKKKVINNLNSYINLDWSVLLELIF